MPSKGFLRSLPQLAAFLLAACQLGGGGTEIPNELTGSVYLTGGQPAADAEVILYPVSYTPGNPDSAASLKTTHTDGSGRFSFSNVANGEYNILSRLASPLEKTAASANVPESPAIQSIAYNLLAFSDSTLISGAAQELPPDTLRAPGSLVGKVQLQPQDDPRSSIVQLLGTDYYTNVDSAGNFTLDNLPQGTYRLQVTTFLTNYVPLFKEITILSGKADSLPQPLAPFYSGIPVVTGLTAQARADGTVLLHWNRTNYSQFRTYLIFRDTAGTLFPGTSNPSGTSDTAFVDTVYKNVRYPFGDTSSHTYEYRVRVEDQAGDPGAVLNEVTVTVHPPMVTSGRWHLAAAQAPFPARSFPNALVFNNALWVIGGKSGNTVLQDAWSSQDGMTWKKAFDSLPIPPSQTPLAAAVFQGKLWVMGVRNNHNFLWNSPDGTSWARVSDSISFPNLTNATGLFHSYASLLVFQNQLWVVGGVTQMVNGMSNALFMSHYSSDGVNWNAAKYPDSLSSSINFAASIDSSFLNTAGFGGKIWMAGGVYDFPEFSTSVWNSADGQNWSEAVQNAAFLPRYDHAVTVHNGSLWVTGGYVASTSTDYTINVIETALSSEVWSSADGLSWTQIDTRAPFSPRAHHAAVSFQNRLWILGGDNGQAGLNDIWYFE